MKKDSIVTVTDRRLAYREDLTPADLTDASIPTLDRAQVLRTPEAMEVSKAIAEIAGRPLGDRLLILPLPPDDRFGSIIIPDDSRADQTCGIVVAVGKGRYENGVLVKPEVSPGNYVVYSKYAARKVKIGRIEVHHVPETDISFAAGHDGPANENPA